jgi:hypothetical protein
MKGGSGKKSGEEVRRVGDIGSQGGRQAALDGFSQADPNDRGAVPVSGFGSEQPAQKAQAGRRVPMVMVNVAENAAGRGEAAGAMALSVEKMEHGGGKDENKKNGHGLFQMHFEMSARGMSSTDLTFPDMLKPLRKNFSIWHTVRNRIPFSSAGVK